MSNFTDNYKLNEAVSLLEEIGALKRPCDYKPKKVDTLMDNFMSVCNSFSFSFKDTYEIIHKNPAAFNTFIKFCEYTLVALYQEGKYNIYDGRNEAAVKMATRIFEYDFIEDCKRIDVGIGKVNSFFIDDPYIKFAKKYTLQHRTLQQSFAQLILYSLYKSDKYCEKFQAYIDYGDLSEHFYKFPLI